MAAPAHTLNLLPAELLLRIFDEGDFAQVLRSSHVCRHWRAIARTTHLFCGDIAVQISSSGSIDILEQRLFAGQQARARLDFVVPRVYLTALLRGRLLCALISNIHRIWRLAIGSDIQLIAELIDLFTAHDAPELEQLTLHAQTDSIDTPLPVLSRHIFAGKGKKLASLSLENVLIPNNCIPALQHLHYLEQTLRCPVIDPSILLVRAVEIISGL
ncbi:hypothetical protein BKA62DRAFT_319108 [Auriculariales sp. MPI-PUGE-AT-0066]|nr:hypothetical protein BKA62DRAFT_319108 [Auriculariales sp. MPI-PUGE-AT-0066]